MDEEREAIAEKNRTTKGESKIDNEKGAQNRFWKNRGD